MYAVELADMEVSCQFFTWPQQASHLTWSAWHPQCRLSGHFCKLIKVITCKYSAFFTFSDTVLYRISVKKFHSAFCAIVIPMFLLMVTNRKLVIMQPADKGKLESVALWKKKVVHH